LSGRPPTDPGRTLGATGVRILSTPMTIPEMILGVCDRPLVSSKTALFTAARDANSESLTYEELGAAAGAAAAKLRGLGLEIGDRVALCCENRPLWGAAYLGIMTARCVCVPLDSGLGEHELREILGHSGSNVLVHSDKTAAVCESAAEALERRIKTIPIDALVHLGERRAPRSERPGGPGVNGERQGFSDPASEAVIIYTSGTTGRPKGVLLSHLNILSNVRSVKKAIRLNETDVFLSVLPLNHTFECTAGFLAPLSEGGTVGYAPSLSPRELSSAMRAVRPTVMLGVPLLYQKLLSGLDRAIKRSPAIRRGAARALMGGARALEPVLGAVPARVLLKGVRAAAGLNRTRLLISGAAPMPASIGRSFRSLGLTLVQGYGLTEASPVVAVNRPNAPRDETVGTPLPGIEIAIDSPNDGPVGEVLVKGENVMLGYYRDPEGTAAVLRDGWLKTGDLGYIDGDGHLHISGRIKDVIVSSAGKNVYPEEIEEVLLTSPFIEEVIVVGRSPAGGRGQQPHALVLPDRGAVAAALGSEAADPPEEAVVDSIRKEIRRLTSGLAEYKRVRGFSLRDEAFPKTGTKKIKRYLFQERDSRV